MNATTTLVEFMDRADSAIPHPLDGAQEFAFTNVPALTAALKRGEEDAYTWLHAEWSRRISRYCFALAAGDHALAAEIAQGTWLRIVRHIRVLHDESALWNWIACAARHAASVLRRRGGRYVRARGRSAEGGGQPADAGDEAAADELI